MKTHFQLCPLCKNRSLVVQTTTYDVPYFGKVFIISMNCAFCHFKHNDVFVVEQKEPVAFTLKVTEAKDLEVRVIRSSSGTIEIPEFGVKIEPGPQAQGYITNVEGILMRVEEVLANQVKVLEGKRRENAEELLKTLREAREGRVKFTLKIKDPLGNSAIISKKAKRRKLTKRELAKLKVGELILTF